MTSKTTLEQIARAAGVSLSTVDRVINRRGGVSPKAEAKVLEWASRLNLDRRIFRSHLKSLRIAILMQSQHNPFYRALRDAFSDLNVSQAELRMTAFIHYIDVNDPVGTGRKIDEAASSYDGLIIICQNDPRLSDALRLHSASLPIVTLVTDIPDCGRLAYVGADNRQMGRVVGELMGRFVGNDGGELLIVLGMQGMLGHEEREMGFRTVLRERFPRCRIVASLESGENPDRAGEVVAAALTEHPEVRGIYNVSSGNVAIARTMQAMGLAQRVTMITHELTASRRQLLRDGILDAVIDQNPRLEAARALEVLARHFRRGDHGSIGPHHTPFDIFIRENCPSVDPSA